MPEPAEPQQADPDRERARADLTRRVLSLFVPGTVTEADAAALADALLPWVEAYAARAAAAALRASAVLLPPGPTDGLAVRRTLRAQAREVEAMASGSDLLPEATNEVTDAAAMREAARVIRDSPGSQRAAADLARDTAITAPGGAAAVSQEPACRWAHGPTTELYGHGVCRICWEDEQYEAELAAREEAPGGAAAVSDPTPHVCQGCDVPLREDRHAPGCRFAAVDDGAPGAAVPELDRPGRFRP